jgi:hypothetical protein
MLIALALECSHHATQSLLLTMVSYLVMTFTQAAATAPSGQKSVFCNHDQLYGNDVIDATVLLLLLLLLLLP